MTDDSLMLFGKHEGKAMKDIPDNYLLWLYEHLKEKGKLRWGERKVYGYLIDNIDSIKLNAKKYAKPTNRNVDWGDFQT